MHKFMIDTTIVDAFLNGENLEKFKEEDIYIIGENTNLFTEPTFVNVDKVYMLKKRIEALMKSFMMPSEEKYKYFLKNPEFIEQNIIIKLVVGMPLNFKKLFRQDKYGKNNIIIDLANYTLHSDDYEEMLLDIEDYLAYSLTLLVLDSTGTDLKTPINTFEHALFCASFASYISESDQLNFMRNLKLLDMWIFLEYDTLKRITNNKKYASRYALEYLDMAITANPEMIVLGVTGKVFLENKSINEAKKLFERGPSYFIKQVAKDYELSFASKVTKSLSIIKNLIMPLLIVWIISFMISIYTGVMNLPFKIFPLIITFLLCLIETLKYKLSYISLTKCLIKIFLYFLTMVIFVIILV